MRILTKKFFESSSIVKNKDSIAIMDFLSDPVNVNKMIESANSRNPALAGVVEELEKKFAYSDGFPLHFDAPDKNAKNRRNIGWMVRYILREFGYTPIEKSDRTRIGKNSGSKFFGNASLYEKTNDESNYIIFRSTIVASKEWNGRDVIIDKDDPDYELTKNKMKKVKERIKKLKMDPSFLASYLRRTGFNHCISDFDMLLILNGKKVPGTELYEAIDGALDMFEAFDK